MRSHHFLRLLKFLPLMVLFLALVGFVVMGLWNWLMPALFGWKPIGYWQAWGLLILGRILFGGLHGGGGQSGHWRHRMKERWEKMTPGERERFRQELDSCWGRVAAPDSKPIG
jgi:hypothetical protein